MHAGDRSGCTGGVRALETSVPGSP